MKALSISVASLLFLSFGCTTNQVRGTLVSFAKSNDAAFKSVIEKLGPKCLRLKKACNDAGLAKCTLGDECMELGRRILYFSKYTDLAIYTAWKALEISKDEKKARKIIADIVKLLAEMNKLIKQAHTLPDNGAI